MSTRRADLFTAIMAELAGITKANGFNTDIQNADDDTLRAPDTLNDEDFPAAYVLDTGEQKANSDVGNVEASLEFIVTGYVRNAESFADLQDQRRDFQQDVERALTADRYHGNRTYVVDTKITDIKTDKGTMLPFAIFDMTFLITYWHPFGTP